MITLIRIVYFIIAWAVATAFAVVIVSIAIAFMALVAVYGLIVPGKTPAATLRTLFASMREFVEHTKTLRPS